jgi:hypothetical protein
MVGTYVHKYGRYIGNMYEVHMYVDVGKYVCTVDTYVRK